MALDGIFLRLIGKEIERIAKGAKVNQVQQPARDELVLLLHTGEGNKRLLISARADTPRVSFTDYSAENPQSAPMFCMLMRKYLCGARLVSVRQFDLERILFLDFDALDILGDRARLTLAVEIMGKHSNCILLDADGVIIDALKRVDMTLSSKRLVLPALKYELPPAQGKLALINCDESELKEAILRNENLALDKGILNTLMGVSPVVCRELAYRVSGSTDTRISELTAAEKEKLKCELGYLKALAEGENATPVMLRNSESKPFDFTFFDVNQYGSAAKKESFQSFSKLLDEYYHQRESIERMRSRSRDLSKLIQNSIARLSRKINAQTAELESSQNREELRIRGDLLQANLYRIERGSAFVDVENFYDENYSVLRIKLDPAKTPAQNAQRYYKDYAKAKNADKILRVQIEKGKEELGYLETVADEIDRAESERELSGIRAELVLQGYIKAQKGKQKPLAELPPREFKTSEGFTVLVGRNNRQNDNLTLKLSHKRDIWLHTKDIPGSHTVIKSDGIEVSETAVVEAAEICAWYSKARESSQVPVDFTEIRFVSKPQGSPPGRVIYTHQHTVYVKPKEPTSVER
ncbi:MAG: NFACT family protein [Ruminococcus sp.]